MLPLEIRSSPLHNFFPSCPRTSVYGPGGMLPPPETEPILNEPGGLEIGVED